MSEDLKPREEPLFPDDDVAETRRTPIPAQHGPAQHGPAKHGPAQPGNDETLEEDEGSSEVLEALETREQNPTPPDSEPEKKRPRKKRVALMIALPLVLAIGGGYFWLTSGRYISTEDAYVQQDKVNVVPEVAGRIVKVGAGENQPVKTGDLLFAIDDAQYRVEVDQAKAAVASARLEVERMKAAYASALADKESADQSLTFAEDTFNRQDRLHDRGFVSQSALDKARLDLQQAQAKARSAEQSVMSAKAALAGNPDIATDDHPEVMQALAKLEAAELDLDHTVVTAPANGIVSQTDRLRVGQYVTSGTSVLSLVETDEVWVEANYKETELTYMRAGQPVEIDVDTYPDHPLKGRVASVGAGTGSEFSLLPAQNATGNWVKVVQRIPVRIAIADLPKDAPLRTGMSVSATVDTGRSPEMPDFVEKGLAFLGFSFPTATAQAHETVAAQGVTQH